MKIHYSPYFNGKAYIDYSKHELGGLLGESVDNTIGLLNRLELIAGLSYPEEVDEEKRAEEYYKALEQVIKPSSLLYRSFEVDRRNLETELKYKVTSELLSWRDTLILAGWDKTSDLPKGKLIDIQNAEKAIPADSAISLGEADRWMQIGDFIETIKASGVEISVHCPKILIPNRILAIIDQLNPEYLCEYGDTEIDTSHCEVRSFKEVTDAMDWLATQKPKAGQIVVSRDNLRIDATLNAFSVPTAAENPAVDSHHIVSDIRDIIDTPEEIIWLNCNGDYGLRYPYSFMSKEEITAFGEIPAYASMIDAVHNHIATIINSVKKVTICTSGKDCGRVLTEHPVTSTLLHAKEESKRIKSTPTEAEVAEKEQMQISFAQQCKATYNLDGQRANVSAPNISYSSLEKLLFQPFDFVVNYEANLWEPREENLSTLIGKVVHKTFELMFNKNPELELDDLDEMFEEAVRQEGHELRLPENRLLLDEIRDVLSFSVPTFKEIMEINNLTFIASEYKIEGMLDEFGKSKAFIDLILKNEDGNYVIIDFKYSESDFYAKKFITNESVQFTIYKEMLEKIAGMGQVEIVGYYMVPLGELYIPSVSLSGNLLEGENVFSYEKNEDAYPNYLDEMHKMYRETMGRIETGIIDIDPHNKKSPFLSNIVLKNMIR